MPGPARPVAEPDEQQGAVEVVVQAAPVSFHAPTGAVTLPQDAPIPHSAQPAESPMKRKREEHRGDGSRKAAHKASPSGASEMSSLSSLHQPPPDSVDDFDATLELSRRPSPPPKEAPQKATSQPQQSHATADAAAALEAMSQPSQPAAAAAPIAAAVAPVAAAAAAAAAATTPGVGWSAGASQGATFAKPRLSDDQMQHVRMWSFGDGKVSERRDRKKPSASAAKKGRVQGHDPQSAANLFSKEQQLASGPQQLPRRPQEHGYVPGSQQPPKQAQHAPQHMLQHQPPLQRSTPDVASLGDLYKQRLPLLKMPRRLQAATGTAMHVKVPLRPGAARQGPSQATGTMQAPAQRIHTASSMRDMAARMQPQPSANQQERGASAIGTRPIQPSLFPGKGGSGNAADSLAHPTLLACDEVLPETDQPLRPMPRINVARDMGLMQPPPLVMTASSVAQKFQERLTAAMSDPGRHSVAGPSFPLGTAGGSAFAGARPEPHIGESSLIPKPRRRSAWEAALEAVIEEEGFQAWRPPDSAGRHAPRSTERPAAGRQQRRQGLDEKRATATTRGVGRPRRKARAAAPVGFFEEPDFTSGGETEPEVSEPPQPPRRAAKARHASRASAAPAQPSLPCSRVATFNEVQRWKRGQPRLRKPLLASRQATCQSPNRHALDHPQRQTRPDRS